MDTAQTRTTRRNSRREDFQVETFRYLEAKLQEMWRIVMNRAAKIAASTSPNQDVYLVEKDHVDKALTDFLSDPEAAIEQLGVAGL